MGLMAVLEKDHELLRSALESFDLHLGPERKCGWEDRVQFDREKFRRDLDALSRALHAHEALEEKLVAAWQGEASPPFGAVKDLLLKGHASLDSLLKVFAAVAESITDGRVHAARTVMTRLKNELTRHMAEEERELFPRLRKEFPASAARPERGGAKRGA